ncbi:hypothetical protein [Sphingobium yanoikuyae]|uniref:hypothetical protein n=1 Tax=Sphingobium yanoikuyae TaxID=13690 RepID=UPI0028A756EB|nr:hypothetical protein [Sphingobium yanoikuyae]
MGRLVSGILLTVAGVALQGIPGVGQVIGTALITAGLSQIASAILAPGLPKTETAESAIKSPRPPRVGAYGAMRLYGACILYETGPNGAAIDAWAVHDGMMTSPLAFYLNDDKVTHKSGVSYPGGLVNGLADGRYGDDTTRLYWTDGRTPGTSVPLIVSELPGVWSSNHRGDGVCLLYLRCASVKSKNFLKRFPNGAPTPSIAAQWQKCPDPWAADPANPAGWTWTENPIRHLMHYKIVREGLDYSAKIAPTISYWRAASDVCNEAVALRGGGSEARYRSCVTHKLTDKHADVTNAILACCDGWIAPRADGALVVFAGKYQAPTVTIDGRHIIAYEWKGVGVDDDQAINELLCSYISAPHDYASVEADAWRDEDNISERGQVLSSTLELPVPSHGQIRRLAKRKIAKVNALYRGSVSTNVAGKIARGHRFINLHLEEAGAVFYSGPVEIIAIRRNMATGGITFDWVAADPNIDAWSPATEEGLPAAIGNRVALTPLDTPTITSAVLDYSDSSSGDGSGARVRIIAAGPDRDDLTWYARWKTSTGSVWNESEYSDIDPGASVELLTGFVPVDAMIDVQVAYQVGDGRVSDWSATATVNTTTSGMLTEDGDMMITEDGDEMIEE